MNKKHVAFASVAAVAAFLGLLVIQFNGAEARSRELRIACNLPLTGVFATYGAAVQEGVDFALKDAGAITAHTRLSFDWQDNEGLPARAVSVLRKQLPEKPLLYLSGVRPQAMAIWDEVTRSRLPHFLWIFDADIRRDNAPTFRTWVNFRIEPPVFLDYAAKRHAKRVSVIYVTLPHTDQEYNGTIVPGLEAMGAEVQVDAYDINRTEFRDISAKMMVFKPDLIILSGFQNHLVTLVKTLRSLRMINGGNTIVTYDLLDAAPLLQPAEIEDLRVTVPSFMLGGESSAYGEWRKRFIATLGKEPLYTHAYAYDMALVLADAATRLEEESPAAYARAIQSTKLEGVTGKLQFTPDGDLDTAVELGVYRNGVLQRDNVQEGQ